MNTQNSIETILQEIDALKSLMAQNASDETLFNDKFLKFTEKEISKMKKPIRKYFKTQGITAHIRKRVDERYNCSYEIRIAKKPFNNPPISASGKTIEEAKANFIKKLNNYLPQKNNMSAPTVPKEFDTFANYYFNSYRIKLVKKLTFENDMYRYNNHLKKYFSSMLIKNINNDLIQSFLATYIEKEQIKTAKELLSLLSGIFNFAIEKQLIERNPCKLVIIESYESQHGTPLTIEEENRLLERLKDNKKYLIPIAVALYTGLRPCEYNTAKIENGFIKAENRKQHSKKVSYKYIPICKRLKSILGDCNELYFPNKKNIRATFISICPNHKLYDLRTTFYTRCEMYNVAELARKSWMGHSLEKLRKAYGRLPDEWFINEMKKLDY